jgi:hypothetical protein
MGAQILLITNQNTKEDGLGGCPAGCWVREQGKSKIPYRLLLRKIDGTIVEFRTYGVDKITGDAINLDN